MPQTIPGYSGGYIRTSIIFKYFSLRWQNQFLGSPAEGYADSRAIAKLLILEIKQLPPQSPI